MRIEWHPAAIEELRQLGTDHQRRIKKALDLLLPLEDPRQRLRPYSGDLKDFWKLRIGDIRLVCQILREDNGYILVVRVAHRSTVYSERSRRVIRARDPHQP
ncbi:type II toxin-antitoxin system RelE/ParE family toxin [Rhizobium sp. 18065]|uniref:type II toxin-antitoxin system RelE family toxin n=1 Tax=Rhizobium sp. 18065 TaxID=2681411 RepID=UPI00135AB589|nr:type II toxin-antitoxin system RelE/ParE family toxin [Rhizobium sp. 18065]